tara:strand:+ start:195 stop:449 length:255 start_codon:yes stop_codon:yes gene_type:complete
MDRRRIHLLSKGFLIMKVTQNSNQLFIDDSVFCQTVVSYALVNNELSVDEFVDSFAFVWGYDVEDECDVDDLKLLHQYIMEQGE